MAKCPVMVEGAKKKWRNCNCDAVVLYRVEYSALHPYRSRENKFFDLVGICRSHADKFADPKEWYSPDSWQAARKKAVNGLRGRVSAVSVVETGEFSHHQDVERLYREDERRKIAAGFKQAIKRMMGQRSSSKLTTEDWTELFGECMEEFVVEQVMDS
jgi:putative NIF3 family GTP cyclohydrolase 1 type 2